MHIYCKMHFTKIISYSVSPLYTWQNLYNICSNLCLNKDNHMSQSVGGIIWTILTMNSTGTSKAGLCVHANPGHLCIHILMQVIIWQTLPLETGKESANQYGSECRHSRSNDRRSSFRSERSLPGIIMIKVHNVSHTADAPPWYRTKPAKQCDHQIPDK